MSQSKSSRRSSPQRSYRRTRSKRTPQSTEPLRLSTLDEDVYSLRAGVLALVCPSCGTWRRVPGYTVRKVIPHPGTLRTRPDGSCRGSSRTVVIDIDIEAWRSQQAMRDRRLQRQMPAESRRPQQQHYKPIPAPATPVHRIARPQPTGENVSDARRAYATHEDQCPLCATAVEPCPQGTYLILKFARLVEAARQAGPIGQQHAKQPGAERASQWTAVLPAVQASDTQREQAPQGDLPAEGPDVPLEPLRVTRRPRRSAGPG